MSQTWKRSTFFLLNSRLSKLKERLDNVGEVKRKGEAGRGSKVDNQVAVPFIFVRNIK